ncbi:MAG: hypothetical protein GY727_12280, partial [Gammaproteobacteria bacterium]|nr:hypothetical protein [Gammaproteobacteria bacterium]
MPPGGGIIDDGDAATSQVGTWPTSTNASGYEGSHYSHHSPVVGSNTYTWNLAAISPGDYLIYAKWTANANRASNAKYDIQHVNGIQTVTVNQKANGSQWELLGSFTIDTSSAVVLSDDADGYVIADAIQLVPAAAMPNTATWAPALSSDSYKLYAKWTESSNRATDATYSVHHTSGTTDISVNQTQNGGDWQLLGTFDLDSSSTVTLNDQANGYVIADALYFIPENQPGNAFTWSTGTTISGDYEVFARWSASTNRSPNTEYRVNHVGGSTTITVDQTQMGGTWVSLGSYTLNSASEVSVLKRD